MGGGDRDGGEVSLAKKGVFGKRAEWSEGASHLEHAERAEAQETVLDTHSFFRGGGPTGRHAP